MTQQVLRARTMLGVKSPFTDSPSFDTYWEQIGTDTAVNRTTVQARIDAFFNTTATGAANPLKAYLSEVVSPTSGDAQVEYYDITGHLDGTPAGSPIDIRQFSVVGGLTQSAPDGVAAAVGYRVDYGTDVEFGPAHSRPRSRDRNRFYFGPLNLSAFAMDANGRCIFSHQFVVDLLAASATLLALGTGSSDITQPVVWSRRNAAVKQPITQLWTDDRPDYQRRRSDPGVRTARAPF